MCKLLEVLETVVRLGMGRVLRVFHLSRYRIAAVAVDANHSVDKPSLIISVADTGEGIAPEHLPNIFERFYRVEDSRSRSEGGAGLGLAIVKQMVQAHGGRVWVESEPGKGSIFYIALPISRL